MDPCPFVRLTVGNLALKLPVATKPASSLVHPSSSTCFCTIKLSNFPLHHASVPFIPPDSVSTTTTTTTAVTVLNTTLTKPTRHQHQHSLSLSSHSSTSAAFHLSKSDLDRLASRSIFKKNPLTIKIYVYTGRRGSTCGLTSGRLLGKVSVVLDLSGTESKAVVFQNGWVPVGADSAQFHLCVKAEPDPRFVFQFDSEPECSPQVFQIQGSIRQPVFTCKFSFRTSSDRNQRSTRFVSVPV